MPPRRRLPALRICSLIVGGLAASGGALIAFGALVASLAAGAGCAPDSAAQAIALSTAGGGAVVGATEYGGPGDPSSGTYGAHGDDLTLHPDSYAELGGTTWGGADALGGLPYLTPLRISWGGRSVLAYKRDIGLGGPPVDGLARSIDLWWQLAERLGIPYQHGRWSGAVRVERVAFSGTAAALAGAAPSPAPASGGGCGAPDGAASLVPGTAARLLGDGSAAAPADAPEAVKLMIAAGNQIQGLPYQLGGGHGQPLSTLASTYDCSSSVEHLLYAAGLIGVGDTVASGQLERFGAPGPGRWVTLYANAGHVFMYVAGLRWDTHDAAGPGDGSSGIGWHPLVRSAAGFVARHPVGL